MILDHWSKIFQSLLVIFREAPHLVAQRFSDSQMEESTLLPFRTIAMINLQFKKKIREIVGSLFTLPDFGLWEFDLCYKNSHILGLWEFL
jgi:hypothetical protein